MNQTKIKFPSLPINPCLVKLNNSWLQFYPAGRTSSEFLKAVEAAREHMGIHNLGLRNMVVTIDNQKAAPEVMTSFTSFLEDPTITKAFMLQMKLKGKVLNVELKEKNNNVPPCAENTTVEPSAENSTVEPSAIELSVKKDKKIKMCFTDFKKALTFINKKTGKEVHVYRGSAPRDENGKPTIDACEYQERHVKTLLAHGIYYVESLNEVKTKNVKGQDILKNIIYSGNTAQSKTLTLLASK